VCRPCIDWEGDEMIHFGHEISDGTFLALVKTIGRVGFSLRLWREYVGSPLLVSSGNYNHAHSP
jgi:hypothetical protein